MGLYDLITVCADWCRCSEGHDLRSELLQTKGLGSTMGNWVLAEDLRGEFGAYGKAIDMPLTETITVYTFCPDCPAFVQLGTWNVMQAWVEFEVDLDACRVTAVRRISEPSSEWVEAQRAAGSIGPMTVATAIEECEARRTSERDKPPSQ